jgi:RNA polymerase-binding transcription factor DksA
MPRTVSAAAPLEAPTPEQLESLRAQLLEQQGFRVDQLRLLCLDRVGASRSRSEITAALMAGARSALRDVRAALARMSDGSYGRCTSCGGQLPLERLEILPQIAQCMACQHASESADPS